MSGGEFGYKQHHIFDIAESIQNEIDNNYSEELNDWGEKVGRGYSDAVIKEFQNGVATLKIAYVYAHRIDYLISGDDGPDSFLRRLKEELDEIVRG